MILSEILPKVYFQIFFYYSRIENSMFIISSTSLQSFLTFLETGINNFYEISIPKLNFFGVFLPDLVKSLRYLDRYKIVSSSNG